jgi:hypothetical protein
MHTIKPASNWKEGDRKMPRRASKACSRRNPTGNLPRNTANGLQRELQICTEAPAPFGFHSHLTSTRHDLADQIAAKDQMKHNTPPPRPFLRRDQGLHIRGAPEIMEIMGFGRPIKIKKILVLPAH